MYKIRGSVDVAKRLSAGGALGIPQWAPSTSYQEGDLVRVGSSIYVANSSFTSAGAFDPSKWTKAGDNLATFAPVRVATTANVDLATQLESGDIVDGVTLSGGDRVLVLNQTNQAENGIYVVQAFGSAVRADDADSSTDLTKGRIVYVQEGGNYAGKYFALLTTVNNVGTDNVIFVPAVTDLALPDVGLPKKGSATSDADTGEGIYTFDASGGAFDFTLPSATGSQDRRLFLCQNVSPNNVTIKVQSGESLNGTTNGTFVCDTSGDVILATDIGTGQWTVLNLGGTATTPTAKSYLVGHMTTNQTSSELVGSHHVKFNSVYKSGGSKITLDTTSAYTTSLNVPSIGRITLKGGSSYMIQIITGQAYYTADTGALGLALFNANNGSRLGLGNWTQPENYPGALLSMPPVDTTIFSPSIDIRVEVRAVTSSSFNYLLGSTTDYQRNTRIIVTEL